MLKSMTGFGRGEYEDEKFSATIEMKTVNHRYNEVAIRLPRFLNPLEDRIRKTILRSINRGRIDVFITADYTNASFAPLRWIRLWRRLTTTHCRRWLTLPGWNAKWRSRQKCCTLRAARKSLT